MNKIHIKHKVIALVLALVFAITLLAVLFANQPQAADASQWCGVCPSNAANPTPSTQ